MSRAGSLAGRLYRGEVSFDFIRRRRVWYAVSGLVLLISVLSLGLRGINPSIDFKGGAVFTFPSHGHSLAQAREAFTAAGTTAEVAQTVGGGNFRVETASLGTNQVTRVENQLVDRFGIARKSINVDTVGASWGSQITNKAIEALVVFLVAVVIYLSARFEPKMALAAIIALLHDLVVTAGVYSLSGLEVSPETVIALLTILGYSLYDTVVVFDKVRENTAGIAGGSRMTFSQAANLGVNQTLMRSINTSLIALMPVAGLLVIGAGLLGAGSLEDLSVAMLIGLATGAYSSIFIATPLLCDFKERESQYRQLARRVAARQSREPAVAAAAVGGGAGAAAAAVDVDDPPEGEDEERAAVPGRAPAGPRQQPPKRRPPRNRGGRPGKKRR